MKKDQYRRLSAGMRREMRRVWTLDKVNVVNRKMRCDEYRSDYDYIRVTPLIEGDLRTEGYMIM